ncbi:MAG: DUF4124 domain-containing protein, partial [Proteobacteria bacterium]|nr:DUF4124 domain-containing protein [Pseudomonadota bacterium]
MIQPRTRLSLPFNPLRMTLVCALVLPLLMGAKIYRWVDDNGVVNFTEQKPRDVTAQEIEVHVSGIVDSSDPTPRADESEAPTSETDEEATPELTDAQRQELEDLQRQEQQRQEDLVKLKAENCVKARALLEKLTINNRIRLRQPDG